MAEKYEDGGPAFPGFEFDSRVRPVERDFNIHAEPVPGMSLRDYFAAKAMQGMLIDISIQFQTPEKHAEAAYKMADAMLKARTVPPPKKEEPIYVP